MENIKILIVDDNELNRLTLVDFLTNEVFAECEIEITQASTYKEAKEQIANSQFNLITLDGDLDMFNKGWKLIPSIKQTNPNAVIMMVSGSEINNTTGMEKGADCSLFKMLLMEPKTWNAEAKQAFIFSLRQRLKVFGYLDLLSV